MLVVPAIALAGAAASDALSVDDVPDDSSLLSYEMNASATDAFRTSMTVTSSSRKMDAS
jgi:hypothetical protein